MFFTVGMYFPAGLTHGGLSWVAINCFGVKGDFLQICVCVCVCVCVCGEVDVDVDGIAKLREDFKQYLYVFFVEQRSITFTKKMLILIKT